MGALDDIIDNAGKETDKAIDKQNDKMKQKKLADAVNDSDSSSS